MRMDQAFKIKSRNENFEVNFNKLDNSQRAAVEALGNNVVIRASAGSGKTSTLITAIAPANNLFAVFMILPPYFVRLS